MTNKKRDRQEKEELVLSIMRGAEYGILSTVSREIHGYPLGSVVSYMLDDYGNLIILSSNLADHTRNFITDARVCMTILQQEDNCQIICGINLFGKVKIIKKNDREAIKKKFIEKFPISKHHLKNDTSNFYGIELIRVKYFDMKQTFWLNLD